MTKIVLGICIIFSVLYNVSSLFRLTKIHCESHDKSWAVINECRLRPISRGVTKAYVNITVQQTAFKVDLDLAMVKRATGYKPFPMKTRIDCCEYLVRRNNPIANLIYGMFKDFSNINHTCPFLGPQLVTGFYLQYELLNHLPLPDGEYGVMMRWDLEKRKSFTTNVYFEFKMN